MSLRHIKLITFDITNTLLRFRSDPGSQYAAVAKSFGLVVPEEEIKRNFRRSYSYMWKNHSNFGKTSSLPWEDWWQQVVKMTFKGHSDNEQTLAAIAHNLIEKFKDQNAWDVKRGGIELICFLREQNIPLGVISNFDPRLHEILKAVDLHKHFKFVLTSYEAGVAKPDPKIFHLAATMAALDNRLSNALHIGDNFELDYCSAHKAGWKAILISTDVGDKVPENHVFPSLTDLYNTLTNGKLSI